MARPVCQRISARWQMSRRAAPATFVFVETFEELLTRWRDAEARGAGTAAFLAADFRGDGPDGRVLDREAWPGRTPAGAFRWTDLRVTPSVGVATGHRDGAGCTVVAARRDGGWQIVNVQRGS
ncbi:nuclear transport factor 2 family protein [Amycolatopsis sp. NPDC051061]|uniref:nuclear transport factor 2 family protein n=1 Tax=Amycolatopsis sp. NPDC051061 TaxID=3155042 RepID=UPI00343CA9FB